MQFDNEESAKNAIDKMNGMLLNDKQVYVGPFFCKQERESADDVLNLSILRIQMMQLNLLRPSIGRHLMTKSGMLGKHRKNMQK